MNRELGELALGESIVLRQEFRGTDPDRARRARWVLMLPGLGLLISLALLANTCFSYSPLAELRSIGQSGLRLKPVLVVILLFIVVNYVAISFAFFFRALCLAGLLPLGFFSEIIHPGSLELVWLRRSKSFLFSNHTLRIIRENLSGTYTVELENSSGTTRTLRRLTYKEMSAVEQYYVASKDAAQRLCRRPGREE